MLFVKYYVGALCVASATASLTSWGDYIDWYQSWFGLNGQSPHIIEPVEHDTAFERLAQVAASARKNVLNQFINDTREAVSTYPKCTKDNLKVRREWNDLSSAERIAFTDAIKCLQKKPSRTPSNIAPGARTRYDDWIATHVTLMGQIHWSGLFLVFHRYFTWSFEQALINECGFNGTLPYWDWSLTSRDGMEKSPIFDGSDTSMSGNGVRTEYEGTVLLHDVAVAGLGTGGGCVTSGPFRDMIVNVGPHSLVVPGNRTINNPTPLAFNPRCLSRSFTQELNDRFANATSILHAVEQLTIKNFQWTTIGWPGASDVGPHSGAHYAIGGDPGRDFSLSPGDPIFWPHHSMVDRLWWMWQMQDRDDRTWGKNSVTDTCTMQNTPPSPKVTMDTLVNLLWVGLPVLPVGDLMSPTDGPFCYTYE